MDMRILSAVLMLALASLALGLLGGCRGGGGSTAPESKADFFDVREEQTESADDGAGQETAEDQGEQEKPAPAVRRESSGGVVIRLKRHTGKVAVYEGESTRTQLGENSAVENGTFYLTFASMGTTPDGKLHKMAVRRTYLTRSRKERLANGKETDRIVPESDELINLGPNSEWVGRTRCYAFDSQNRVAYRAEDTVLLKDGTLIAGTVTKREPEMITIATENGNEMIAKARIESIETTPTPHVLRQDSPHYLFPILSSKAVSPGDDWAFRVPVIVPMAQGGDNTKVWPTAFEARVVCKLREIQGSGKDEVALIDYKVTGGFDTHRQPYTRRFGQAFLAVNRIAHDLEGSGTVSIHLAKGLMLDKKESVTVNIVTTTQVPAGPNKPPNQMKSEAKITSEFHMRLLPPGTKLKNGKTVPPLE